MFKVVREEVHIVEGREGGRCLRWSGRMFTLFTFTYICIDLLGFRPI